MIDLRCVVDKAAPQSLIKKVRKHPQAAVFFYAVLTMANEKNLKIIKTTEDAQRLGRAGGVASGVSKRENKIMRRILEQKLGQSIDKITEALLARAATGDVRAYEAIRDTVGEKPTDKYEMINAITPLEAKELEDEIAKRATAARKATKRT
jgi:hypothetical protein